MTAIALLEWIALAIQFWLTVNLSIANGVPLLRGITNYFSYFTILCNLLVALVLTFTLWAPETRLGRFLSHPTVESGVALYMTVVGIVYSLALRHIWDPQGLQKLADLLLHDLLPVLYVVFWFLAVSKKSLRWVDALWWLVFPGFYCAYSLVRGAFTGWYPYPFLDPGQQGYARVSVHAMVLLCAFLAIGYALLAVGRWQERRAGRKSS